jgi:hypothetical protein
LTAADRQHVPQQHAPFVNAFRARRHNVRQVVTVLQQVAGNAENLGEDHQRDRQERRRTNDHKSQREHGRRNAQQRARRRDCRPAQSREAKK